MPVVILFLGILILTYVSGTPGAGGLGLIGLTMTAGGGYWLYRRMGGRRLF